MEGQTKTLKEKLVSRLRFEPERTEVLLMVKGRYSVCEPAGRSKEDSSEQVRMDVCSNVNIKLIFIKLILFSNALWEILWGFFCKTEKSDVNLMSSQASFAWITLLYI